MSIAHDILATLLRNRCDFMLECLPARASMLPALLNVQAAWSIVVKECRSKMFVVIRIQSMSRLHFPCARQQCKNNFLCAAHTGHAKRKFYGDRVAPKFFPMWVFSVAWNGVWKAPRKACGKRTGEIAGRRP